VSFVSSFMSDGLMGKARVGVLMGADCMERWPGVFGAWCAGAVNAFLRQTSRLDERFAACATQLPKPAGKSGE
jgi:hypothetical protein